MRFKSIGITGTRIGATGAQLDWLLKFLTSNVANVLNHGDCVGVDEQVAAIFAAKGSYIIAHPGDNGKFTAGSPHNNLVLNVHPNLIRNKIIVDSSHLLLAFPDREVESLRSGTWMTIRYAERIKKPLIVVSPKGNVIMRKNNA